MDENKKALSEEELDEVTGGAGAVQLNAGARLVDPEGGYKMGAVRTAVNGNTSIDSNKSGYCPYTEDRRCRMNRNFDGGEFCQECGWRAW